MSQQTNTTVLPNTSLSTKAVAANSEGKFPTKKQRAKELYLKFNTLPREQLITKFVNELGMPENSARTHISMCAKELNASLGLAYTSRKINKSNLKREKAMEIYKLNAALPRKDIIEKLKNELNMTYNSAATHCSICAKALKGPTP